MTTIEWRDGSVRFLDQTLLPGEETYVTTTDYRVVADAIRALAIRGAPLIGIAAAYAVALAAREGVGVPDAIARLASTRPTAVNLFSALERMGRRARALPAGPGAADGLLDEALAIHREDVEMCAAIGRHGAALIPDPAVIVTHCNAGALATGGIGTALGVITTAAAAGKNVRVFAGETRPLFQGSRLTAWELGKAGIDVTILTDGSVPYLMSKTRVDAVVIGADRIAANGDVANKIGSYGLARAAADHGVPFYVAAPRTTVDPATASGGDIPIEERSPSEVAEWGGKGIAAPGAKVWAPAFDVTPAGFVTAIVTEAGVHRPPYAFGPAAGPAPPGAGR
jgi:methylthioribose-1-phosphate isomerase